MGEPPRYQTLSHAELLRLGRCPSHKLLLRFASKSCGNALCMLSEQSAFVCSRVAQDEEHQTRTARSSVQVPRRRPVSAWQAGFSGDHDNNSSDVTGTCAAESNSSCDETSDDEWSPSSLLSVFLNAKCVAINAQLSSAQLVLYLHTSTN